MVRNVIIIGSGPAGYTASLYMARAGLNPLLLGGNCMGGQLMYTTDVENYPGFANGVNGVKLMMEMRQQALNFGTEIIDKDVTDVDFSKHPFTVFDGKNSHEGNSIIITTGGKALTLGLKNEEQYIGRGVSVCAVCDAAFYKNKVVYVVGGGDSAMEDCLVLTKFAKQVLLVVRKNILKASKIMQDRVMSNKLITVLFNTEITNLVGKEKIEAVELYNNIKKTRETKNLDGLFYAIGHLPNTNFIKDKVLLNSKGYILTSQNGLNLYGDMEDIVENKYITMTSVAGVFAAGDVVNYRHRQAIIAAGSGAMAALDSERWLSENIN